MEGREVGERVPFKAWWKLRAAASSATSIRGTWAEGGGGTSFEEEEEVAAGFWEVVGGGVVEDIMGRGKRWTVYGPSVMPKVERVAVGSVRILPM